MNFIKYLESDVQIFQLKGLFLVKFLIWTNNCHFIAESNDFSFHLFRNINEKYFIAKKSCARYWIKKTKRTLKIYVSLTRISQLQR